MVIPVYTIVHSNEQRVFVYTHMYVTFHLYTGSLKSLLCSSSHHTIRDDNILFLIANHTLSLLRLRCTR